MSPAAEVLRRGFKSWAENQAKEARAALGLGPEEPLPAARLAEHLGAIVVPLDQLRLDPASREQLLVNDSEAWSALTVFASDRPVIVINPTHSAARRESDLMHELAHVLCKHTVEQVETIDGLPLRDFSPVQEAEATWLGGCLQLPRVALVWALKQGMSVSAMVEHFGASRAMVDYRLGVTGALRQIKR